MKPLWTRRGRKLNSIWNSMERSMKRKNKNMWKNKTKARRKLLDKMKRLYRDDYLPF